jgi:CheY-like chemotaxis protein
MHILLVDDEPLLLKSFARYLGGVCGHDVFCAGSGGEALARLESGESVDLIFCDLTMPDIDGVEVHRVVCENHPQLRGRFVFLTGGAIDGAAERYLQSAGALVLAKPIRHSSFDKILADVGGC